MPSKNHFHIRTADEVVDTSVDIEVDVGTAADVEAVMRKYDRESNTRTWEGTPGIVVRVIMVIFSLYCIWSTLFSVAAIEKRLTAFIACVIIMVALIWFVNHTSAGHAMQAVSEDRGAAQLMGVNVNATISLTFAIGSALAAVAGALLCSSYPTLQPTTGAMPGIKAFVAAVFGGIGSIPGAFLGGILLGIIENLSKAYISTQLSDAIVFLVLVVVLIVKPTGLLGKKVNVKV